jgi:hypothetical protein
MIGMNPIIYILCVLLNLGAVHKARWSI